MNTHTTIPGTEEAWESGALGNDEKYIGQLTDAEFAEDTIRIQESLGLQPISIRLEQTLIDDFKAIATIHGLGYQTLMRQALKRFADCEKKKLLADMAAEVRKSRTAAKERGRSRIENREKEQVPQKQRKAA